MATPRKEEKYAQQQISPAWRRLLRRLPATLPQPSLGEIYERLLALQRAGHGRIHVLGQLDEPIFAYEVSPPVVNGDRFPVAVILAAPEVDAASGIAGSLWLAEQLAADGVALSNIGIHLYIVFICSVLDAERASEGWVARSIPQYYRHAVASLLPERRVFNAFPVRYKDWQQPSDYPGNRGCAEHSFCHRAAQGQRGCRDLNSCEMLKAPLAPRQESLVLASFLRELQPDLIYAIDASDWGEALLAQTRWQPSVVPMLAPAHGIAARAAITYKPRGDATRSTIVSGRDHFFNAERVPYQVRLFAGIERQWEEFHKDHSELPKGKGYSGNVPIEDFCSAELPRAQLVYHSLPLLRLRAAEDETESDVVVKATLEMEEGEKPRANYYSEVEFRRRKERVLLYSEEFGLGKQPESGPRDLVFSRMLVRRLAHARTRLVIGYLEEVYKELLPRLRTPSRFEEEFLLGLKKVGSRLAGAVHLSPGSPRPTHAATKALIAGEELQHALDSARLIALLLRVLEEQQQRDVETEKVQAALERLYQEETRGLNEATKISGLVLARTQLSVFAAYASDFVSGHAGAALLEEEALVRAAEARRLQQQARRERLKRSSRRRESEKRAAEVAADAEGMRETLNERRYELGLAPLHLRARREGVDVDALAFTTLTSVSAKVVNIPLAEEPVFRWRERPR